MDAHLDEAEAFVIPGLPIDLTDIPEAQAPLIRNAWYVIAHRSDVDRSLKAIRALGEPLVYYRSESGEPIVLDDRCAHRRFPLSKSRLVGDTIQCGYHGFQYAANGRCIWAPGVDAGLKFGVRAYPSAERGSWLWVWMGDPEKADAAEIPLGDITDEGLYSIEGYKYVPGNYLLLIENLLDLSHIHFLHGADAATLGTAVAPPKTLDVPDGVGWYKLIEDDEVGLQALWCGGDPKQAVRTEQFTRQHGPSLHVALQTRVRFPGDEQPLLPSQFRVLHALTPADEHNTHQFYWLSLDKPLVIATDELKNLVENVVFEQDVEAIGASQAVISSDRRAGKT